MRFKTSIFFALVLFIYGCGRISPPNDSCVRSLLDERIQKQAYWASCQCEPIQEALCYLLEYDLTVESAVQIALLNNPRVQVIFDEIGIAHADLIEAGLFRNPIFEGYVRFPNKALDLNTQFSIAQSFLDIFLVPLKKKIAAAELEKTKLKVAYEILNLAFEVEETFYHYVTIQKKISLLELLVEATEVSKQLAILQKKQGNINDLELQVRMNEYLQAKMDYTESKIEIVVLREKMNRLLGLSSRLGWCIAQDFPHLPKCELPCECLETIALSKRLDIEEARWEVERLGRMWKINHWWASANGILGISTEHEAEGFQETGPSFSLPLPFFNYGQANRARIQALYDQSVHRLKELEVSALSEVRAARDQLLIYRRLIEDYQCVLLPLQESILTTSQRFYNYMTLSVYKLIGAKKQEIEIQIKYIAALGDFWKTRVDLDRALGGNLHWALTEVHSSCNAVGDMK